VRYCDEHVCLPICLLTYLTNDMTELNQFLGHLLRDDLINPAKMSIRPYVRPSVRPSVRTSTIKHNAFTNQIVVFVKIDETFTTI